MADRTQARPWDEASRGGTLASDAERERAIDALKNGFCEGRLDREEYEERMDAACRARTYAELAALLRDLPRSSAPVPAFAAAVAGAPWSGRENALAAASLLCGLTGLVLVVPLPAAIVLGHRARGRIRGSGGSGGSGGNVETAATVGAALGYLGAICWALVFLWAALL